MTLTQAAVTFREEYKQAMNISSPTIREVGHRFLSIDFPSERLIDSLGEELRKRHQDNLLIINLSEREYDVDKLPGHVLSLNFRGFPAPPLDLTARLCMQIHQWLTRSPANMVAIHCFPGLSRTAVLICCYLAWSGVCVHPVDALIDVCIGLKIDVEANPVLPSQKRYMNYFFDFLTSQSLPTVPAKSVGISKLILNGGPNLLMAEDTTFRPFIEIWQDGHLIFSTLPDGAKDMSIEELVSRVESYSTSDVTTCVSMFTDFRDLVLSGDLLFRVRHLTSSGQRLTCMRFAFNTNYVHNNMLHFGQLEIDGNTWNDAMIDVVFHPASTVPLESSLDTLDILKRAKAMADKLRVGSDLSDPGSDIEEVILLKKVLSQSSAEPQPIGRSTEDVSKPVVEQLALSPPKRDATPTVDEVDDFFAQLEKDAQI